MRLWVPEDADEGGREGEAMELLEGDDPPRGEGGGRDARPWL